VQSNARFPRKKEEAISELVLVLGCSGATYCFLAKERHLQGEDETELASMPAIEFSVAKTILPNVWDEPLGPLHIVKVSIPQLGHQELLFDTNPIAIIDAEHYQNQEYRSPRL
jgi:hypothetical protein